VVLAYEGVADKEAAQLTRSDNEEDVVNKWTHSTGGNKRYGGWRDEAFDRLNVLRNRIKKSRKKEGGIDGIAAMEKAFLFCLRQRLGLEENTKEAEIRKRRDLKRKKKAQPKNDLKKAAKLLKTYDSDAPADDGMVDSDDDDTVADETL